MRYYIYLDKCFLRSLFSVIDGENFEIEVVEYSVRKSSTVSNQIGVNPYKEELCENERDSMDNNKKEEQRRNRKSGLNKQGMRTDIEYGNSISTETQKRYINIDDITDMKNTAFYHGLVKRLKSLNKENSRLALVSGYIEPYVDYNGKSQCTDFFVINNKYIWYDKSLLQGDINLLLKIPCKVDVLGYTMSSLEKEEKIIKAIAIYIE